MSAAERDAARRRERAGERSREGFSRLAEIGPLPAVVDPDRKERCRGDLFEFLTTYFPETTGLKPFSDDHWRIIGRLQRCILFGGRFIGTVFRGFAKTTIAENACLWATLYGHRKFIPLLGADADAAENNLDSLKLELSTNELLLEDFPEVCYPIRRLENRPQRCATQTLDGRHTHIGWTADKIVLPTVAGSDASGACIQPSGLMACNRGMTHKTADGRQLRPDFVFIDDPQTDESAASPAQVQKRLDKLHKTVLKLGGHSSDLAVFIAATVIRKDDLADQLLDPAKYAAWQGERVRMVKQWAKRHEDLWLGRYAEIRNNYDPMNPDDQQRAHREATQFYRENREAMDAGCEVAWDECYNPDTEASAIQHAYNLLIDDGPDVFASECQNEPTEPGDDEYRIEANQLVGKMAETHRGVVPSDYPTLTAFVDISEKVLWWMVVAWRQGFGAVVIDYGSWPDQKTPYFTLSTAKRSLRQKYKCQQEAAWLAGIDDLVDHLTGRTWSIAGGGEAHISRLLIDSGYGDSKGVVYRVSREHSQAGVITPSKGVGVRAGDAPMGEWNRQGRGFKERRRGFFWIERWYAEDQASAVLYDTNAWKSLVARRLMAARGDPMSIELYRTDSSTRHRMLVDQLAAEKPQRTEGRGRTVIEWKLGNKSADNHYFDCLVGCAVAASMCGVSAEGHAAATRKRERVKLSDLQKRRRSA